LRQQHASDWRTLKSLLLTRWTGRQDNCMALKGLRLVEFDAATLAAPRFAEAFFVEALDRTSGELHGFEGLHLEEFDAAMRIAPARCLKLGPSEIM